MKIMPVRYYDSKERCVNRNNMSIEMIKVNNVPDMCKDCIFECEVLTDEGNLAMYNCNLKYWLNNFDWDNGVFNCPCPLDGKVKNHLDGREDND